MRFQDALRLARTKHRYSQEEASKVSGVPKASIRNYEGGSTNPPLSQALKLSKALGFSLDELVAEEPVLMTPRLDKWAKELK